MDQPAEISSPEPDTVAAVTTPDRIYRHRLPTRIWHWTNAITLLIMLMSGLMIFNAHPRLYWGSYGANADYAWLEIGATRTNPVSRVAEG